MIMTTTEKAVRQSVTLPARLARRVRTLAKNSKASTNRVLVELIETGIESKETEKSKFFELADQLSATSDPIEQKRIKKVLAKMTFGE
jgi:predicted DNA-binding protein